MTCDDRSCFYTATIVSATTTTTTQLAFIRFDSLEGRQEGQMTKARAKTRDRQRRTHAGERYFIFADIAASC